MGDTTWPMGAFCFSLLMALETPGKLTKTWGALMVIGWQEKLRVAWGAGAGVGGADRTESAEKIQCRCHLQMTPDGS